MREVPYLSIALKAWKSALSLSAAAICDNRHERGCGAHVRELTDLLRSTASSNSVKTPLSLDVLIFPVLSGEPPEVV